MAGVHIDVGSSLQESLSIPKCKVNRQAWAIKMQCFTDEMEAGRAQALLGLALGVRFYN